MVAYTRHNVADVHVRNQDSCIVISRQVWCYILSKPFQTGFSKAQPLLKLNACVTRKRKVNLEN